MILRCVSRARMVWPAVVVVAVAVVALVLLTTDRSRTVEGAGRPASPPPGDEANRALLDQCRFGSDIDLAALRIGPVVKQGDGQLVVTVAPDNKLVLCHTETGSISGNGPYQLPPGVKIAQAAEQEGVKRTDFAGWGWVAPDVARVEVELPDGRIIQAQVASGAYAYTASVPSPVLRVTLRAYDIDGNLIDQRKCPCSS